jgi:PRTRC genetic system ThiF family protein
MKHLLPSDFTENQITVAVAGAGGNGSQFINGLARMHIALRALGHPGFKVILYDPDVVTDANVGRQLFSPSDIGQFKSKVLINRLNCYFGLKWFAETTIYNTQRFGDGRADILVGCVDSAAARRDLAKTRFHYWLDLGNTDKKGQVILGTRRPSKKIPVSKPLVEVLAGRKVKKPKVEYLPSCRPKIVTEIFPELKNKRLKEDTAPSCSLAEALERQDLFINQSVATFALQLLWQFIRNGGLDIHGYFINLESGRVTPLPIK